jgi:hypothetical protein
MHVKPKYLSTCDREECGCGEGAMYMCESVVCMDLIIVVYYESRKRELKIRLMN